MISGASATDSADSAAPAEPQSAQLTELLACLRLASPALPIGGFSYSQGLETAIDRGWVTDEASARAWIDDCLALNIGHFEAPMVVAMHRALAADDAERLMALNEEYLASRESSELRAESAQMGYSLCSLILDEDPDGPWRATWAAISHRIDPHEGLSLPLAWALASKAFGLSPRSALAAYLWAWAENQVMAAIKAVPLGQLAGQRLLRALVPSLASTTGRALELPAEQWFNGAPGFAMASAWHETQYSRMFRS